jgi:methyl-accepting chemotaxis protein
LRVKFLVPTLVIIGLFSAAILLWTPWQVENLLKIELTQRGKLAAETLDKSAIGALVVQDQRALDQLAKGFIRSNEILYVLILDKDGQNLADSGIEKKDYSVIQRRLPQILKAETDFVGMDQWPSTADSFFHIARPVFYEQLRIGTIVLGISARWVSLAVTQLRLQLGFLCGVVLLLGAWLSVLAARSLSQPLQKIAASIAHESNEKLEILAGNVKEFNQLVEGIQKTKNLFTNSLDELEHQKRELETDLAKMQEENTGLSSRVSAVTKQAESLQEKMTTLQSHSGHLSKLLPLVQFATGIAPEIDSSMQHISRSAEQLREDLERLRNLLALYEKASPLVPEDLEVIRQYKSFINYEQIRQSMDELVTTIRGGADWAEQLADLLKQISVGDLTKAK